VRDVALAVDAVCRLRPAGVFNVANEPAVTAWDLAESVARVVRRVSIHPARSDRPHATVMSTAWTRRELGWRPTVELDDGIRGVAQWLAYEVPA
jgi:nucleoside-diphosphate-sugar epimerase